MKKSSKKSEQPSSIQVTPEVDRSKSFQSICPFRRPTINPVLDALRELVSNAEDEGATEIRIIVDRSKKLLRVCDNGVGFGSHQKTGFFWLFKSEKRGAHRAGKRMTGQHGTGRLRTLQFAQAIEPCTMSSEDQGRFYSSTLTRIIAEEIYDGSQTKRHWHLTARPIDWHLPPGQTGSVISINMSDEQWKVFPDTSEIVDRFARLLSPRLEQIIRVNGRFLKPRSILKSFELSYSSKDIERQIGKDAAKALGDCLVQFYMPEQIEQDDEIKLGGARNIICSLGDFLGSLPDASIRNGIPPILKSGKHIFGYIFIDGLNQFAAEDRHSLTDAVYDGMHVHISKFLADVVGPQVEAAYASKRKDENLRERRQKLATFSDEFSKAFARKRSDRLGAERIEDQDDLPSGTAVNDAEERTLVVRPPWFHILPGETQEIEVTKHLGILDDDIEWVASELGGHGILSATSGKKVQFTARALGKTSIIVRDRKNLDHFSKISITIVPEKKLKISPPHIPVEQGSTQQFRARNSGATSAQLSWELKTTRGLRLSNTEGLQTTLTVSDACPLGQYVLRCWDTQNPGIDSEAIIEVVSSDAPSIELDGKLYYFRESGMQPAPVVLEQDSIFTSTGAKAGTIQVYFDHPDFLNLAKFGESKETTTLLLFESIILLHLQAEHENGRIDSIQEVASRYQEHRSRFLAERAKKK